MQLCYVGTNLCLHLTKPPFVSDDVLTRCGRYFDYCIRDEFAVRIFVNEPDRICKACLRVAKASVEQDG